MSAQLAEISALTSKAPTRVRELRASGVTGFKMDVPAEGAAVKHQLFADSIVSGGANPMGLGGWLWREGDVAFMEVQLGKAFEGAPGRAHGGIVAALIDETMGLVLAINEVLAFTVQLDITYRAPTPVNKPIICQATLAKREGRKLFIDAKAVDGETLIATATSIFVAVDPTQFLAHVPTTDS